MNFISASPAKLRSGDWGARVRQGLPQGATVDVKVTTKAGKTWTTTGKVIWSDGNVSLLATGSSSKPVRPAYSRRGECAECGEYLANVGPRCWATGSSHVRDTY